MLSGDPQCRRLDCAPPQSVNLDKTINRLFKLLGQFLLFSTLTASYRRPRDRGAPRSREHLREWRVPHPFISDL
jgi:hypothetical protein